ncbi:hypothetical protein [Qipengyuania sp. ASV99]
MAVFLTQLNLNELARTEVARVVIVLGCSAALILAGRPLPF